MSDGQGDAYGDPVRYLPFGEVRSGDLGELPTDHGFTGHKHEADHLGLIFMQARYYVAELGRFVSPDILIPDPADPQSYDRYAYVLNNPLVYRDPTGYFSEKEIVGYFGVDSWLAVVRFFDEGGELEGLWGWLRILREAELGDRVTFWDGEPGTNASKLFDGVFSERNGRLFLTDPWPWGTSSQNVPLDGARAGKLADGYSLSRWEQSDFFTTAAVVVPEFHADTFFRGIDWGGLLLDTFTIGLDVLGSGTVVRALRGASLVVDSHRLLQLRFAVGHARVC